MEDAVITDDAKGAVFSRCRTWRYTLWRQVQPDEPGVLTMNVIGLNPSTATERTDGPTVRRCIGFAKAFGFRRLVVTNIFAYRATNPSDMLRMRQFAVGQENDRHLLEEAIAAQLVVAAWGTHGAFRSRGGDVLNMLSESGVTVHCFGVTKDGYPKHPLYLPNNTGLEVLRHAVRRNVPEVRVDADAPDPRAG